ncbi:MAG: molybdate ABC transporter substrate-binding protein [Pseudomonadota bacterium]
MLRVRFISLIWFCLVALPAQAEDVTIFAAASLKTALDQVTAGQDATVSYAASSTLARQIEMGAPADIVILASRAWMEHLNTKNRLIEKTRRDLLGNELVLVAPSDMMFIAQADRPVDDIIGDERIASALVDAVPAGIYAKQALASLGIWDALAPQLVQTDNVRAALRLVALGQVSFGIVYVSDVRAEPRVQVVHRFDARLHDPIVYPMAIVAGSDRPAIRAIWDHIQSPEAAEVFERHGFASLRAGE